MSGLAHYFEDEGLTTVIVALVREHIVSMRPPRALWVPFELGRPFGPPFDTEMQGRVLRAALTLLDQPGSNLILQDFDAATTHFDDDANWGFPGVLDSSSPRAEALSAEPVWQQARARIGKTCVGISGLTPVSAVEFIERYHADVPMPNPKGMARVARARFAIDDIKAFYLEAATAAAGHPSSRQLQDWFWKQTLAGAMIRQFQDRALDSDDSNLRQIAASLVPAERTLSFLRS